MIDEAFLALISTDAVAQFDEPFPVLSTHWTSRRKAALVAAIKTGEISLEAARRRFRLSDEEFNSWLAAIEKNGTPGLRATRFQVYRDNPVVGRSIRRRSARGPCLFQAPPSGLPATSASLKKKFC
jgi:hypothetical protein